MPFLSPHCHLKLLSCPCHCPCSLPTPSYARKASTAEPTSHFKQKPLLQATELKVIPFKSKKECSVAIGPKIEELMWVYVYLHTHACAVGWGCSIYTGKIVRRLGTLLLIPLSLLLLSCRSSFLGQGCGKDPAGTQL